jgi:hypothetical protein
MNKNLQELQNIFGNFKGFSAKILSYDGSSGITGHLHILFQSFENRCFLISCRDCSIVKANFQWQIERLNFDIDIDSGKTMIIDMGGNLKIITKFLTVFELLNIDVVSIICNQIFPDAESKIILQSEIKPLNSLQQLDRVGYDSPNLKIGEFKAYFNMLYITLEYVPNTKKELSNYDISLVVHKPISLYFNRKNLNLKDIKLQESNNIYCIKDVAEKHLLIECCNIQICNTNDLDYSVRYGEEDIEWFLSTPITFSQVNPKLLISL